MLLQSDDKTVLFAVGSTLVNCTNSYDAEKPDPQLVELAKYAKQHVPEEHPKVTFKRLPHDTLFILCPKIICLI